MISTLVLGVALAGPVQDTIFEQRPLDRPTGADDFGDSGSIVGTTAIVGAPRTRVIVHVPGSNSSLPVSGVGRVHAFELDSTNAFVESGTIEAPTPEENGRFGASTLLLTNQLVVGAPGEALAGRVHVFDRVDQNTWQFSQTLEAPLPLLGGRFGARLRGDDDTLVIGREGADAVLSVYERNLDNSWSLSAILWDDDEELEPLAYSFDYLDGRIVAGENSGGVVVYDRVGPDWIATDLVFAQSGSSNDIGESVAFGSSKDELLVAMPSSPAAGVQVLARSQGGTWSVTQDLDGTGVLDPGLKIGPIESANGRALIGYSETFGPPIQLVLFERDSAGTWILTAELIPELVLGAFASSRTVPLAFDGVTALAADHSADFTGPESGLCVAMTVGSLRTDVTELSLATGGTQELWIRAGDQLSGAIHVMIGSATGIAPVTSLDPAGANLRLVVDPYTSLILGNGGGPLTSWIGLLDASGRGGASLEVPAGTDPSLAGLRLFHAAILFDASTLTVAATTNPVHLDLVP